MEDKLQSAIFKSIMTGVFVTIAYLISNHFVVTEYFLSFLNPQWHITVSIAIYTSVLNSILLLLLSKRTEISVDIYDKQNDAYSVSIEEKPRIVSVKINMIGNLEKVNETITVKFPEWVDSMVEADPSINQVSTTPDTYVITPSDKEAIFYFSIRINDIYGGTPRKNDVIAVITGNCIRYNKIKKELKIQYKK